MMCHVQGLTLDVVLSMANQVLFIMEELIRVGKIYFPTLDMTSDKFINFRRIVDSSSKHDDMLNMMHAFNTWRRGSIVRGCLDMIVIGKMDGLRLMWVVRPRVDIHQACVSFRRILLIRKNIDLGYCFESIEAIGVWPTSGANMFETTLAMHVSSVNAYQDKLNSWTQAADFHGHDNLRAFQVRCMFDLPKRKCMGDQLTWLVGEVLEGEARQTMKDDIQYEEDLEQADHLDIRMVDAWPP